ncbi:asparagine synthase (glutamine-hydrolyzing) [Nocardiopsis alba]|uniref:asparagine synthase (glutamine-hydrolyzing) n=1 Tax=Nocardiopsis alba TaxID=53437 RepID=UPI0033BE2614
MCGITGWIDFTHDAHQSRDSIERMTDSMLCRGPDAQGVWLTDRVAFGHTRTAVIDPGNGRQPMSVDEDGRELGVITFNGEVYNYEEIRTELRGRGHRFRTGSDTEVLLRAYLEWGVDCVHWLHGIFAFAIWDARTAELLLFRDHLGVKPLFYARTDTGVLFGSEPKAILAHPDVESVVDADGLRELLSQAKTPGASIYAGIREVRPGHVLRVRDGRVTETRYWRLEADEHPDDLETTIDTVRRTLSATVAEQLVSDVPVGILASGGLDSSAIAALSREVLRERGEPLRLYSVNFEGFEEGFRPDEVRATPDITYAHLLARHMGVELREVEFGADRLASPEVREAIVRAQDRPTALGDMDLSVHLLCAEVRKEIVVGLTGECADEVFSGYNWTHIPELVYADTFPWVAVGRLHGRARYGLGCGLLDRSLMDKLDVDGYTADQYGDTLAEAPALSGEAGLERRMRQINHMHLTRWLPTLLDRVDRISMAHGLELRVPFCDPGLVQYLFNVPWEMKSHDGREKSLLRSAMRGLVPDEILDRRKSPYPVTQDARYARLLCGRLQRVLNDPSSPVVPLVDAEAARAALERPEDLASGPGSWAGRADIEMILNMDVWLRGGVRVTL